MSLELINYIPVTLGWVWFVIDWGEYRWTYHKMKLMLRQALLKPMESENNVDL